MTAPGTSTTARTPPTFREAFAFWLKLGFISFGGPAGQIAIMQTELVEKRRWISQPRFLHALNFCMLLPGPEATQLAIYVGWLLHGTRGGIAAGALFVLPSMFILWALSFVYAAYGSVPAIAAVFYGLKPVVMAIVAAAVIRIARKALKTWAMWAIAAVAFVAIFYLRVPFPVIVLGALALGFFGGVVRREWFVALNRHDGESVADELTSSASTQSPWRRAARVFTTTLALWWIPVVVAGALQGWQGTLFRQGLFFSKAAVVTFGGAYAVLPYVAQQAVDQYGWLGANQMMDGLGLAETTPGPLIMVLQFVGFMGGWNQPGALSPWLAATLAALLTTWVTFVPCFLWIFLGAPHVEQLRGNIRLQAALSTVTAAVVGVILNLAIWFGWQVVFPAPGRVDWLAIMIATLAFIAMLRWKLSVVAVVLSGAIVGIVLHLVR